jgi:hypothetical protein
MLVSHTGGWPGQVSRLSLVPGRKLGVIVLTSAELGVAFNAVTYRALDMMLGREGNDWLKAYTAAYAKSQADADTSWQKHLAARAANSTPSLPSAKYAGTYRDPWYGDVILRQGSSSGDAVQQDRRTAGRPRTLAARQLHRALARPQPECRCLREFLAGCGRQDPRNEDGAGVAVDRFQLRFPGPEAGPGGEKGVRVNFLSAMPDTFRNQGQETSL